MAQTDSSSLYLFQHISYSALTETQKQNSALILSQNPDNRINVTYVKVRIELLQNGYFYANFSADSMPYVTGKFESYSDWADFYWVGSVLRSEDPREVKLPVTIRAMGKELALNYRWRFFSSDSIYEDYFYLKHLGEKVYLLGHFHHKFKRDPPGVCGGEPPYNLLPWVVAMAPEENFRLIVNPLSKLGKRLCVVSEDTVQALYTVTDMCGKTITLMDQTFYPGGVYVTLPNPDLLSNAMYIFRLLVTGGPEKIDLVVKVVKLE
ncbi:MAG: hypothetical protein M3Q97_06395 [Bacteroidota bacterium]|nr:hypothetical protein [Bacteroidota bacterium]